MCFQLVSRTDWGEPEELLLPASGKQLKSSCLMRSLRQDTETDNPRKRYLSTTNPATQRELHKTSMSEHLGRIKWSKYLPFGQPGLYVGEWAKST